MSYADYLVSDQWQDVKRRYRASKLPKGCVVCGESFYELHHRTYRRRGKERLTDLVPVCRKHHQAAHDAFKAHRKRGGRKSLWTITTRSIRQQRKANRHPQRDGQVRPDPITANGGATASAKPVANPDGEAASQSKARRVDRRGTRAGPTTNEEKG